MEVQAVTKYVGISPQKVRLVVDQVRGMSADEALGLLRFMSQASARPVAKMSNLSSLRAGTAVPSGPTTPTPQPKNLPTHHDRPPYRVRRPV